MNKGERIAVRGRSAGKKRSLTGKAHKRTLYYYILEALCLGAVVAAAFFTPQLIFRVQDGLLCRDTVLGQRESMNVAALATAYETSLADRMRNFADALAEGESFYVTSQALEESESLEKYLYSDSGLYGEVISRFIDWELLPTMIWSQKYPYSINKWKQYVIYSDNYAKGVNFILWYVELVSDEGDVFRLLADAEDGTIYAVNAGGDSMGEYWVNGLFMEAIRYDYQATELWAMYVRYYESWTEQETGNFLRLMAAAGWAGTEQYDSGESDLEVGDEEILAMVGKVWYWLDGSDSALFRLPFGENSLEVKMELGGKLPGKGSENREVYSEITIGVHEIYEMIPEFA